MAKKWIKLHRKLLLSKDLNLAANEYGLAERLFYRMLLAADDYGRLPADPWVLRGHIGPLMKVSEKQIVRGIECLQSHGLIAIYTVGEIDYIVITQYHTYQQTDWSKVGAPQCPHPTGWELPKDLRSFLEEHAHQAQFRPDRYGLSASQLRRLLDGDRLQGWRDEIRSRDELQCRNCGATVGIAIHHILPFRDYPALAYEVKNGISLCDHCHSEAHRGNLIQDELFSMVDPDSTVRPHEVDLMSTAEGTLDVEVDVEVEVEVERELPSSKTDTVSEPPRKAETAKQRQQRLLAEEEALREQFSADELQLVDAYIEIVDSDLKRGTTPGGRVTRMQQLIDVANDINELVEAEGLPPERAGRAFLYGLEQACNAGAANKNYVKTCAISSLRRRE